MSPISRRFCALLALCAVAAAGCFGQSSDATGLDGVNDPGLPPECSVNDDCVAAGPSCCEAWTHAVPRSSGWEQACEDVSSQCDPVEQPGAEAMCASGSCVLQCLPVVCDQTFENGYATDSLGCLKCEGAGSAPPAVAECQADADCIRVPADCCGCENGGDDTAVASSSVDGYLGGLGCDPSPSCPGVNVCQAGLTPRCLNNTCVLLAEPNMDTPPDAGPNTPVGGVTYCGSADLPPCPTGQVCVLNAPGAQDANQAGLGVCSDP